MDTKSKIKKLRLLLKEHKINKYIIPHNSRFRNENLHESEERLKFISNFTGSAGTIIISEKNAHLFVDGRYVLQAPEQVNTEFFKIYDIKDQTYLKYLQENIKNNDKIGIDPWLFSYKQTEQIEKICKEKNAQLKKISQNLIDLVWSNKPAPSKEKIKTHLIKYAGVNHTNKISQISQIISKKNIDALIINDLSEISWLLNIRGNDISYAPHGHYFAILYKNSKVKLFTDKQKISSKVEKHLTKNIQIFSFDKIKPLIKDLKKDCKNILVCKDTTPIKIIDEITKNNIKITYDKSPISIEKSIKNKIEIKGAKNAHKRDAIAVIEFLSWFEEKIKQDLITEIDVCDKLEFFRKKQALYQSLSFPTIAGAGENGAIIHYNPTNKTNKEIEKNSLLLIDSGAQYLDGTTDVTRTILIGKATKEQKQRYTEVLQGHIELVTMKFPKNTKASSLDILARKYLLKNGNNYAHGTGHGVGSYSNVHEGPFSISPLNDIGIIENIILSNEPGFYKEGEYGIRIENLIYSKTCSRTNMLKFENLTLIPYETRLIDKKLLLKEQIDYINKYHEKIQKIICPYLSKKALLWLKQKTKKL